jgi:hypothetical protein
MASMEWGYSVNRVAWLREGVAIRTDSRQTCAQRCVCPGIVECWQAFPLPAHDQGPHSEYLRQARRPQPDGSGYQGTGFGAIAIHLAPGFLKSALGIHKVKNGLVTARFLLPLPGLKLPLTARRNYHSEYHVRGMTLIPPCGYAIGVGGNQ